MANNPHLRTPVWIDGRYYCTLDSLIATGRTAGLDITVNPHVSLLDDLSYSQWFIGSGAMEATDKTIAFGVW